MSAVFAPPSVYAPIMKAIFKAKSFRRLESIILHYVNSIFFEQFLFEIVPRFFGSQAINNELTVSKPSTTGN
jgi:hypothetical protein